MHIYMHEMILAIMRVSIAIAVLARKERSECLIFSLYIVLRDWEHIYFHS